MHSCWEFTTTTCRCVAGYSLPYFANMGALRDIVAANEALRAQCEKLTTKVLPISDCSATECC